MQSIGTAHKGLEYGKSLILQKRKQTQAFPSPSAVSVTEADDGHTVGANEFTRYVVSAKYIVQVQQEPQSHSLIAPV